MDGKNRFEDRTITRRKYSMDAILYLEILVGWMDRHTFAIILYILCSINGIFYLNLQRQLKDTPQRWLLLSTVLYQSTSPSGHTHLRQNTESTKTVKPTRQIHPQQWTNNWANFILTRIYIVLTIRQIYLMEHPWVTMLPPVALG